MSKNSTKILLIDDLGMFRMVVRMELNRLGYTEIDEAEDGLTAHFLITQSVAMNAPYAAIICDWDMPGLTGIELLEKIRQDPTLPNIPFVMLTGDPELSSQLRAFNAGATDYLVKPISADTLAKKIEQVVLLSQGAA